MRRFFNFLAGFLMGLAIGGTLAALFAPQSGGETLDNVRGRVRQILDDARQAADETRDEAQIRLAELKAK